MSRPPHRHGPEDQSPAACEIGKGGLFAIGGRERRKTHGAANKKVRRVTLSKPRIAEPSVKPETSSFSSHDGVEAN